MVDGVRFGLTLFAALGCGLVAGVLFAFSTFVMKALASVPPATGIAAMQAINVTVLNPPFLAALVGSALATLVLVVFALVWPARSGWSPAACSIWPAPSR
jgi:uncharacterized membrane protein